MHSVSNSTEQECVTVAVGGHAVSLCAERAQREALSVFPADLVSSLLVQE